MTYNADQSPVENFVDSVHAPIGVPRVSTSLLRRERLLSLLNAEPATALMIVQAGSGFGKTTLLADWIRTRPNDTPAVWVTADESVHDAVTFWREALDGLSGADLVEGTALSEIEVRGDIADMLSVSLRRGFASLSRPVTLVVDGFERLVGTEVERDLFELLRRTDRLQLVIATQVSSELSSLETATQLDTVIVKASALRFDADEVRILASRLGIDTSRAELEQLREELDGWPFGIRAVLERRRRDESSTIDSAQRAIFGVPETKPESLDASFAHRHLLVSLDGLDGLDELALTSVLDSFTLEQAAVVGADLESHSVLAELESRGLGAWHLDATPPEYRLHPVLRRALRDRLDRDPEAAKNAFSRLAGWHLQRGDYARAFETAIHTGQWELAARCVRSDLFEILVRLRLHPDMLAGVPRHVLKTEPLLMLVDGIAHYASGNQARAVRTLLAAVAACERERLVSRGVSSPDQVWVQGILTIALRLTGRYELVPAALRRFGRMLEAVDDPAGHLEPAMLLFRTQSIITLSFIDQLAPAEQLATDTVQERHQMTQLQQANLLGLTALAHARRGDMECASAQLKTMDALGTPRQFDESFFAVTAHIAAAWSAIERFEPDEAAARLSRSDRHWPTMEYWPFVLEARTQIEWQRRGPQAALLTLREGRAEKRFKAPIGNAMSMLLMTLEAELLLAAGLTSEAVALMTANRLRRSPRLAVPKSRSLLLTGNWDYAVARADRHALSELQPWQNRVDLLLISASANLRAGDRDTAQQRFDQAFEIAERTATRTPFISMPREDLLVLGAGRPALLVQFSEMPARYPEPGRNVNLSRREQLVVAELASERTLPEIARKLSVSTNTLKSQLRSVYRKLDVPGRQEAVQVARRTGLLFMSDDDEPEDEKS